MGDTNKIAHLINKYLEEKEGRVTLARLIKHMKLSTKDLSGVLHKASKSNPQNTLEMTSNSQPWVFYHYDPNRGKDSLEYTEPNLNKVMFRRFSDYLREHDNQTLHDKNFARHSFLAFPYACGLRKSDGCNDLCPKRFTLQKKRDIHLIEEHGISGRQMQLVSQTDSYFERCGMRVESETVFLEQHNLLNVFDPAKLRTREDLPQVMNQFNLLHTRNYSTVDEMTNLVAQYKRGLVNKDVLELCERHVQHLMSRMLKADELRKYITTWMRAVNTQNQVLKNMNDICERVRDRITASDACLESMLHENRRELQRAGNLNFGAIAPDTALQYITSECTESSLFALNMIASQASASPEQVQCQVQRYMGKRKRNEEDDDDGDQPRHRKSELLEIVQPLELRVSLADFPQHTMLVLGKIESDPQSLIDLAEFMTSVLDSMFLFTPEGRRLVKEVVLLGLQKAKNHFEQFQDGGSLGRLHWLVFCRVHQCLNSRMSEFAPYLRVRLTRHLDRTRTPVQHLDYGYPSSSRGRSKMTKEQVKLACDNIQECDLRLTWNDPNNYTIQEYELDRHLGRQFAITAPSPEPEVREFMSRTCCICKDPLANRPLECFNCRDKRETLKLGKKVPSEDELYRILSSRIQAMPSSFSATDQIGAHIFHKACIRQYIQYQAIDGEIAEIVCPECRTVMYNEDEKDVILRRIYNTAMEISACLSDNVPNLQSDEIIDMKGKEDGAGDLSCILRGRKWSANSKDKEIIVQKYLNSLMPTDPKHMYDHYLKKPSTCLQAKYVIEKVN